MAGLLPSRSPSERPAEDVPHSPVAWKRERTVSAATVFGPYRRLFAVPGVAFVGAVVAGGPRWSWFLLAAAAGGSAPNTGSLVRARWSAVLDPSGRQTASAFEAVADEVVFVVGPVLVTLLATLVAPPVGFLTGVVLGVVGACGWRRCATPIRRRTRCGLTRRPGGGRC